MMDCHNEMFMDHLHTIGPILLGVLWLLRCWIVLVGVWFVCYAVYFWGGGHL